ncbi:MAG: polysaccharide pyruvyl transferase family protein [Candidatus Woesearchaeota archaeon]
MKRLLIYGYYGTSNTGSDARLNQIIKDVKKLNKDIEISVAVFNQYNESVIPNNIRIIKMPFIPIISTIYLMFLSLKFDIIINGEGIPYTDFCGKGFLALFLPVLFFANHLNKFTVSYAFDIDKLTKLDTYITKKVLEKTNLLITRTKESYYEIKEMGISNVYLSADPAFLYKNNLNFKIEKKISFAIKDLYCYPIKFSLLGKKEDIYKYPYFYKYENKGKEKYNKFITDLTKLIEKLSKNYKINLIAMEDFMDKKINQDLLKNLKNNSKVSFFSSKTNHPQKIKKELITSKLVISTRLHALILSTDNSIPFIGISNDERIDYFFKEYGLSDLCINYKIKDLIKEIEEKIDYTNTNYTDIKEIISSKTKKMKKRASFNHNILKQSLTSVK